MVKESETRTAVCPQMLSAKRTEWHNFRRALLQGRQRYFFLEDVKNLMPDENQLIAKRGYDLQARQHEFNYLLALHRLLPTFYYFTLFIVYLYQNNRFITFVSWASLDQYCPQS